MLDPTAPPNTCTPIANLMFLGFGSSAPHIDAAHDPTYSPGNIRDMHEFVVAWEDAGTINYWHADMSAPGLGAATPTGITTGSLSDVAFFSRAGTNGYDYYIDIPYNNTATGNLEVLERRFNYAAPPSNTIYTLHTGHTASAVRIAAMDEWDGVSAPWEVAANMNTSGIGAGNEVWGYNRIGATVSATNMSGILTPIYGYSPETRSACVAAGLGTSTGSIGDIGNTQYTLGFYPWRQDSNYARHIDPTTGALINPTQCYQVNDISSPVDYHFDINESMGVTNCSNTGMDMLTAWYNGTNFVYKYSSPNVMAFRQIKPQPLPAITGAAASAYGLSAGDAYTILDMNGKVIRQSRAGDGGRIETGEMAAGMYLLRRQAADGSMKTYKLVK